MNLIVSLAASSDCTSPTPSVMEIEYIKVWQYLPPCDANNIQINGMPDYILHAGEASLVAKNSITTNGDIQAFASQTWRAGDYIELNPGFETVLGADISFEIGDCNATNLRIIPNDDNTPIILQSAVPAGKNNSSQQKEKFLSENIQNEILPNPSSGIFTIITTVNIQRVEVLDIYGKIILSRDENHQKINLDIDLSSHPKGIYFVRVITTDGQTFTEKVVVQ